MALLCLTLWWRRRWPVHLAVLATALGTFSASGSIAGLILLFTLAVHRRASVVAAVAALNVAAGVVFVRVRPDPSVPIWVQALLTLPIIAAVVAWGMFARARRQLVVSLRDRARRAEAEQQLRIEQARYLERARIAREMHDVLAHRISLVSLHAGALEYRPDADAGGGREVGRRHPRRARTRRCRTCARSSASCARRWPRASRRRSGRSRRWPTSPASSTRAARPACGCRSGATSADLAAVPASVGRTAYRVVQEGLTNARKHAPGAEVTVSVSGGPGPGLTAEVRNRWPVGVPAGAPIPGAGQGLTGLTERAAIAGGRLEHGRLPSGDFRLSAWLPWPDGCGDD